MFGNKIKSIIVDKQLWKELKQLKKELRYKKISDVIWKLLGEYDENNY